MKYGHILSKRNRALLAELVRTDFKLRYQGSVLGYMWSLLRPLLLFTILYTVFVRFLQIGQGIPHYGIYLLLGIVIWNFFGEMTSQSLTSIVGRGDLIRKIRIPRWIIIMSSSVSALINLGLNLVVVIIFMIFDGVQLTETVLWVPLLLVEIYLLSLGISLLLSALFVRFRDMGYIWEVIMQAGFYATPILYPLTLLGNETFRQILLLNPMAQAIQDMRYSLVTHDPQVITIWHAIHNVWYLLVPFTVVAVLLLIGVVVFRRESKYFAENI